MFDILVIFQIGQAVVKTRIDGQVAAPDLARQALSVSLAFLDEVVDRRLLYPGCRVIWGGAVLERRM
jgi:hypothetical protein